VSNDRIPLQRSVAVVTDNSIAVRPAQAQVVGAAIELGLALVAIGAIVLLFDALPIYVLMVLLLLSLILGPVGVLGLVYGAIGTSFVMERDKQSARWQQGFLGLGIGTNEFVPFARIDHIDVATDEDETLPEGERQDLVQWDVRLIKDNGRQLTVGTVVAARPLADVGAERANRLAGAVAEMGGVQARLAAVPQVAEPAIDTPARPVRRRYRKVSGATLTPPPSPPDGTGIREAEG
jgi:hypothetical protein